MNAPSEVLAFERAARRYCSWAEAPPGPPEVELQLAIRHLADVYAAGAAMPGAGPEPEAPERFVDKNENEAIYRRFQKLPFQGYAEVFDTVTLPPEEPTVGDVADDLLDVYTDLKSGLLHYDAGNLQHAVFQWRFSWGVHWGRHATSALRAMHCFLTR